ncbi:Chaperone protein DnaJ [subsurface metagenome]
MTDNYFYNLLDVAPGATPEQVKHAFHNLARKNHPDFFPEEKKPLQEARMMALNEAYDYLLNREDQGFAPQAESKVPHSDIPASKSNNSAVGFHKDPSYAYYKQGFVNYSRALNGIMSVYHIMDEKKIKRLDQGKGEMAERFINSLTLLRLAHGYFSRVVAEHTASMWRRDADIKLKKIERFTWLYRRILNNMR